MFLANVTGTGNSAQSQVIALKSAMGANISAVPGFWSGAGQYIGRQHMSNGVLVEGGWAPNATGVVGIRFITTNAAWDCGWVRLSYTPGTNGLANTITATDSTSAGIAARDGQARAPTPQLDRRNRLSHLFRCSRVKFF
jgi:hypothetical protein